MGRIGVLGALRGAGRQTSKLRRPGGALCMARRLKGGSLESLLGRAGWRDAPAFFLKNPTFLLCFSNSKPSEKKFYMDGSKTTSIYHGSELIKEVFSKIYVYQKPGTNPLRALLHMLPAFYLSCSEMLSKWEDVVPVEGSHEIDVWPHMQQLSCDVISRIAFGRSYEEGRKIFELQKEQVQHLIEAVCTVYIPGWR
uniref:CYP72A57 n=1 Tax=Solanum tuberosum TaxID=4113 RepID=M1AX20_SOLTU